MAFFSPINKSALPADDIDHEDEQPMTSNEGDGDELSFRQPNWNSDAGREYHDSEIDENGLPVEKPAAPDSKAKAARRSKRAVQAAKTAALKTPVNPQDPKGPVNLDDFAIALDLDTSSGESGKPAKRSYQRTGMHSKDPAIAALARAKHCKGSVDKSKASSTRAPAADSSELLKMKQQLADAKSELMAKDTLITGLNARLAAAASDKMLAVSNAALASEIELGDIAQQVYERGFQRAMTNFEDVKRLMRDS